jgi:tripartite ATP-independent transporter DctM subunit
MLSMVLFGTMLVLFALNVPIAIALGIAATLALLTLPGVGVEVLVQRMFYGLDSFLILSVPLFLLLGEVMQSARITDRLVEFAQALVGRVRGGLGHVSIITNMLMAGISGSGTADAAATGVVLMPVMSKAGYRPSFAAALVGSAATIGPIIPPSIIMIMYASIAGVSIARIFIAGLVPGILMGLCLMAMTAAIATRRGIPRGEPTSLAKIVRATRRASLVLVLPLIVVGGIVGGVFTATESASVGCLYALALGLLVYRSLPARELPEVLCKTALSTGRVMFILATASVFSWILARGGVPDQFAALPFFADASKPWLILLTLNILLFVLGTVMEAIAILLITVPMILPIATAAGIDPIHLGVVMSFNLTIGLITPPMGSIMFVLCGIGQVSVPEFAREAWPFIVVLVAFLLLITYVPEIVLFLPDLLLGPA